MDLKREIKLADLLPKRPQRKRSPDAIADEASRRPVLPGELVGLKIEAAGLSAAHVLSAGTRQLLGVAQAPIGPGIVHGGEVRDPAALAAALADFFKTHELPKRGVRLGLANSRIGVRTIEVTGVDDSRQLENAIGFRAHELLSVPPDEAVIDHHVLETVVDEDGTATYRILLVVAYRDSIDRYLAATDAAGLELAGIDLEAFALLRAGVPGPVEGARQATVAAVSIDHDLTTLAIADAGVCRLTRVLEWGAGSVDAALTRSLKVTAEQAAELRRRLSEPHDPTAVVELPRLGPTPASVAEIVGRELSTLVRELQSSFRFYEAQPDAQPVGEVVISGSVSDLPGFARALGEKLGSTVRTADPFARVELASGLTRPARAGSLVVAVGLGIED